MKRFLRKILPKGLFSYYHLTLAYLAALRYGFPSRKMIVIGVTGTKGKTTASNFIWSTLSASGKKVGIVGTANIRIGGQESLNKFHMTMPGRFALQGILRQMVDAGCAYCVVEVTSEGINQFRHKGINFDVAVFTNLYPEHLPSHGGSFENYKKAKGKLFAALAESSHKVIEGERIEKVIAANFDSDHKDYYLGFSADKKITFGLETEADIRAEEIQSTSDGVSFKVGGKPYDIRILGEFNVYNALAALAVGTIFKMTPEQMQQGLSALQEIPGRMEVIENTHNLTVIVDYAHQKESMYALLEAAQKMRKDPSQKIIVLLGAEGGGRDKAKRPAMGQAAGTLADYVICSNVDPYEDDPFPIANDIAVVAERFGKTRDVDSFVILDRREGIRKALELSKAGDIVLITGKGAEQSITIGGVATPWDDRTVVREELEKLSK
jgi:UDP-N-acetylmuramoyl-L-alanyl-D-glutamate--2,6-diaminopimelate ligase